MATAAELLAGVIDVDRTLIIDSAFRTINIPSSVPTLGVEYDDDVLRLDFKMPRYATGTDLSGFSIRINYINAQGESDAYTVSDAVVGDRYITFTWLVGPTATRYKGNTKFNVCAKTLKNSVDEEGNTIQVVDREFNTTIATLPVLEGLEVDESIVSEYSDLIEQWRRELFGIGDTEEASIRAVSQDEQAAIEAKGAEVLATIPAEYTETVEVAQKGIRTKADAIICKPQGELISVSDSSDDYLRGLKIFGKTTQAKTTGVQLFNPYAQQNNSFGTATISGNGSEITVIGTYYVSWPIVLKAGVTYYVNFETAGIGTQRAVRFEYDDKEITDTLTNPGTFTPTRDTVSVYLYSGLGTENCVVYKNFQICEGSTPVPWEPYSAGHVSPSPNWHQPLRSAESSEITITGKNLLDMSANGYYVDGALKIPYTSYNSIAGGFNKIRVYPGRTYTFSYKFTTGDRLILNFLDKDEQRIGDVKIGWGEYLLAYHGRYGAVGSGATFTIPEDSNVVYLDVRMCQMNECGEGNFNYYYDLQLEEGPVATEYEPYKAQSKIIIPHTLNGIPLTSGGNYTDANGQQWLCDEIDFERGVYVQRVYGLVSDYNTAWKISGNSTTDYNAFYWMNTELPTMIKGTNNPVICTHFTMTRDPVADHVTCVSGGLSNQEVYFFVPKSEFPDVETWTNYVVEQSNAGTPITTYYILNTPIETPLTAEELAAFKALHTNYPNTTVLNDAGATMELAYNADTKTWVENYIRDNVIIVPGGEGGSTVWSTDVPLNASAWTTSPTLTSLHSQVITIPGTTAYSRVDLFPSMEQLAIFHDKDVAFTTENKNGVITAYAIGDKPTQNYTMQAQITEVLA